MIYDEIINLILCLREKIGFKYVFCKLTDRPKVWCRGNLYLNSLHYFIFFFAFVKQMWTFENVHILFTFLFAEVR